ncbi:MAG: phosphatase PAP2 family protein [Candidatus Woesearchaeota archaeon]
MKHKNTITFIAGLALFAVSLTLDKYIPNLISLIKTPSLDVIFSWVTSAVSIFVILILITTLFLFQGRKREWVFPLWISFISSAVVAFILKLIIARPRPYIELIYPLINILDYSFPSMHAMVAFAVVPILDKEFFKIKWFWILFAVLVAFSRIYFGLHFLSDVVFGGFFGYFIGVFIINLEEKYKIFRFLK